MAQGFLVTEKGKALLAKITAGEQRSFEITRVMVGSGELSEEDKPEYFDDLIQPVAQASSTIPMVKNNVISFIVEYRNDMNGGLKNSFWLKEFGVFVKDGEQEILLYYATLEAYPQYVEAYQNGKLSIKKYPVSIAVSNIASDNVKDIKVTMEYSPIAFVTEERLKEFTQSETLPYLQEALKNSDELLQQALENKADKQTVTEELAKKADKETVTTALEGKANVIEVEAALNKKANTETVQAALEQKANVEAVQRVLNQKADTQAVQQALEQKADEMEMLTELAKKVDKENMIEQLAAKVDKEEIQKELDKKVNKEDIKGIVSSADMALELDKKADKETVAEELAKKADAKTMQEELNKKADTKTVQTELDKKADNETMAATLALKADNETMTTELEKKANTSHEHSADDIKSGTLPITRGGTGNTTGNAATATKLKTARTLQTNLASTSSASFDGSANITAGVTGTLPIANGGTGNTTGNAATTTKLKTVRTIDGMNFDGSANIVHFGICNTAADVAEKTVTLAGFVLAQGARVAVYFANRNTAGSPMLNINGTGAHYLAYRNGSYALSGQWENGDIVEFVYYNSHWIMLTANARKLTTARTIALSGDMTGSASFDGSANKTIATTLANSGVTAGTYGALDLVTKNSGTVWVSNNVGLHGTSAICTWKAKQACKISFRWRISSESVGTDYLNITAAGTQILANTGGSTEQTGTLTATLAANQTLVFTYRKDGSVNNGIDRAEISEIKYGSGTADPSTVIYENNVENYFEITNNTYGFYPAIPIPTLTVDTKGRVTKSQTIYVTPTIGARHSNGTYKEGIGTTASGACSHAEGQNTTASGGASHAEGRGTIASGGVSHAEGYNTKATSVYAHAEGIGTTANGWGTHAEGDNTQANEYSSHAEGRGTIASASESHAGGYYTKASALYQMSIGKYNKESTSETDKFIIGNGTSDTARSNCLRVTNTNGVYSNSTYKSSGADYAETFEWADGNRNNEDRTGLFVTLTGDKIRLATPEDSYILGVVSACPSICGDVRDDIWGGMFLTTIFGCPILEEVEIPERTEQMTTTDENGGESTQTIVIEPAHIEIRQKLNPEYDHTKEYIPRSERSEWDAVGVLGKLVAVDDGSCEVDGWCKVGQGGIATKSEEVTRYRVMKRLDETHIKVFIT